ncbi:hypothetical protein ABCS02_13375 [Microbacterium sp. X-17]|uniref:hypothetical protein n=1 Tax=Microbacterium sp. X-17 TaxID=3144404 RepID=UPI0031F5631C
MEDKDTQNDGSPAEHSLLYWLRAVGFGAAREVMHSVHEGDERSWQELADEVSAKLAAAVSPEDLETTRASLQAMARALGWDEAEAAGKLRGFGPGRGFGPRRGFGPGRGFGPWGGYGPGFGAGYGPGFGPHHHGHHGHGGKGKERAYERGFAAGFAAARGATGERPSDAA